MALTATVKINANSTLSSALDLGSASSIELLEETLKLATGTGASQGNQVFSDTRSLGASSSEELDLSGSLTNGLGVTVSFSRVVVMIVRGAAANGDTFTVGGSAANGFDTWVLAAGDAVTVRPGGTLCLVTPDSTGYAVTAATGDLLKITNNDAAAAGNYDIVLIGSE